MGGIWYEKSVPAHLYLYFLKCLDISLPCEQQSVKLYPHATIAANKNTQYAPSV